MQMKVHHWEYYTLTSSHCPGSVGTLEDDIEVWYDYLSVWPLGTSLNNKITGILS